MDIRDLIEDMLKYKETLGYSRNTYYCHLLSLAKYLEAEVTTVYTILTLSMIEPWCKKRPTEIASGYRKRISAAREFTKYLYARELCDGVLPAVKGSGQTYTPYIFTDLELRNVFEASDLQPYNPSDPLRSKVISAIYRLIFFCGLRPNEGRELRRDDYDQNLKAILIRKNKTHKERLIPVSEDIHRLCTSYLEIRDSIYPDSEYFFPKFDGKPYSAKWLTRTFKSLWVQANPNRANERVRVYDLRHRYATTVLMEWLDNGEDIYNALPYLSAYMGHSELDDTSYYIHLIPSRLQNSEAIDWKRFESLLPEVQYT